MLMVGAAWKDGVCGICSADSFVSSSDDCVVDEANCVSSKGYLSGTTYGNYAQCMVSILQNDTLRVEAFDTQAGYDFVTLRGERYSGQRGPHALSVFPGDNFTWASDSKYEYDGWRICGAGGPQNCPEERCTAELHVGAVWNTSGGACVICSVNKLHNCPESMCTGELHAGALFDMWHWHAIWAFENQSGRRRCSSFSSTFGRGVCRGSSWRVS